MKKCVPAVLGLGLWLTLPALGQEEEIRAIFHKAIAAHGGEDVLTKFTASHSRSKGKLHIGGGLEFTAEEDVQLPDKFKSVVQLNANGMDIVITQVFDGKKGWVAAMGKTTELDDKAVTEIKELLHAARVSNLTATLKDKNFKFAALGEVKVKDKDAVGVRVSYEGRRDVNLYFDKSSGLIVKAEGRGMDPVRNEEVNQEKFFSAYRDVDGRKTPRKVEILHDGKAFVEAEVLELRLFDRHDDSTFNRP
jgi:hypothetical protein